MSPTGLFKPSVNTPTSPSSKENDAPTPEGAEQTLPLPAAGHRDPGKRDTHVVVCVLFFGVLFGFVWLLVSQLVCLVVKARHDEDQEKSSMKPILVPLA